MFAFVESAGLERSVARSPVKTTYQMDQVNAELLNFYFPLLAARHQVGSW